MKKLSYPPATFFSAFRGARSVATKHVWPNRVRLFKCWIDCLLRYSLILSLCLTLLPADVAAPAVASLPTNSNQINESTGAHSFIRSTFVDSSPGTTASEPVGLNGLAESPWPMFLHDPQHTGRSEYIGPQDGEVKWISDVGTATPYWARGSGQPVIGPDGVIYFGFGYDGSGLPGRLYALNPDGTIRWQSFDLEGYPTASAVGRDGTIYLGTSNGLVYALDAGGTEKWRFYCEGGAAVRGSSITLGPDGTLYFASSTYLYALRPDGIEKWRFDPGDRIWFEGPAIGPDGTIYELYMLYTPAFGTSRKKGMVVCSP